MVATEVKLKTKFAAPGVLIGTPFGYLLELAVVIAYVQKP
jgi:hypothetical protein